MIKTRKITFAIIIAIALLSVSASAQTQTIIPAQDYTSAKSYYDYFPITSLTQQDCESGQSQDIIVQIPPGGCSPPIVRSDLLEEQNVPVFCKMVGLKVNPLIEVPVIKRVSIPQSSLEKGIEGVVFYPARAALSTSYTQITGSPISNNLGYIVVVLKQQPVEKNMPDVLDANLTAKIEYDLTPGFGIGDNDLILKEISDDEWNSNYKSYSFWNGKGYLRARNIQENNARIDVYFSKEKISNSLDLSPSKKSDIIYMPGMYCSAGLNVRLNEIKTPETVAELVIDGNKVEVTRGMKVLNNLCIVSSIETPIYGVEGAVTIKCPGVTQRIERPLATAELSVDGEPKTVGTGGIVFSVTEKEVLNNYTLAYAGKHYVQALNELATLNVVVIKKNAKMTDVIQINKDIKDFLNKNPLLTTNYDTFEKAIRADGTNLILVIGSKNITRKNVAVKDVSGLVESKYSDVVEKYYKEAINNYEETAKGYGGIKNEKGEVYGEQALFEAMLKAEKFKKSVDEARISRELISDYPDSKLIDTAKSKLSLLFMSGDNGNSAADITTDLGTYHVVLGEIREPGKDELSASFLISDETTETIAGLNEKVTDDWELESINEKLVTLRYVGENKSIGSISINVGGKTNLNNKEVKLTKTTLKKYVSVSVLPYSKQGVSYTNFSVHIGIDKRVEILTPEKTKEIIEGLNKTIKDWEEARDKLGETVTNWRKACFIGSGVLWVETFLENLMGGTDAIARNYVMRQMNIDGYDGWTGWCSDKNNRASEGAGTASQCLGKVQDRINKDMKVTGDSIDITNKLMSASEVSANGILDRKATFAKIQEELNSRYSDLGELTVKSTIPGVADKKFTTQEISNLLSEDGIKGLSESGNMGLTEARDLAFNLEITKQCQAKTGGTDELCKGINSKTYDQLDGFKSALDTLKTASESKDAIKTLLGVDYNIGPPTIIGTKLVAESLEVSKIKIPDDKNLAKILPGVNTSDKIVLHYVGNNLYAFVLGDKTTAGYFWTKALKKDGDKFAEVTDTKELGTLRAKVGIIEIAQPCDNKYESQEIRYWDSGPFKGYAAIMPLGNYNPTSRGWYAATQAYGSTLGTSLTNSQAFAESGEPKRFWICNVGKNGRPDFADVPSGDDKCCQEFALTETYTGTQSIYGLGLDGTREMVQRAYSCFKDAANQYGKTTVRGTVRLQKCGGYIVGRPKELVPSTQCEDFMAPWKCRIMYNLCDPVLCPPSRCDFGGSYKVNDVIQTGVIGSMFLCLPNFPEVAVPVCLTGVHAGLDSYVSMMKAIQGCLKENLENGTNIGICDQMKSIYMCEFFWRQFAPFIKTGLPNLIQNVAYKRRTGGEYLTFKETWDNSIKAAQFFTEYYGENAFEALKIRSTEEAGTAICRAFVGLRYPNQADLLDELSKPESPVQYNAWFDEIPFSDVTTPATSHYKVYWHIFSGNDQPAYYSVYLKEPPYTTFTPLSDVYYVATGYIEKGQYSDESRDFTAPSGYKQLCVRVNLKEECGFKKVSTGFLTNYLTDAYLKEQTTTGELKMMTPEDCTSGQSALFTAQDIPSSLLPVLTQPSVGGVEESLQPGIWRRGIVRVCSQDDPGKGVSEGRWSRVGFCGNEMIGCWVDEESIKAAIKDLKIENATITQAESISKELLLNEGIYLKDVDSGNKLKTARDSVSAAIKEIKKSNKVAINIAEKELTANINGIISGPLNQLNEILDKSLSSKDKAEAQNLVAELYNAVADKLMPKVVVRYLFGGGVGGAGAPSVYCPGYDYRNEISNAIKGKDLSWMGSYDPNIVIQALISRESGGKINALSTQGAAGLMQLMPETYKACGIADDVFNAQKNIDCGVGHLISKYNEYGTGKTDGIKFALAAWLGAANLLKETNNWNDARKLAWPADANEVTGPMLVNSVLGTYYTNCKAYNDVKKEASTTNMQATKICNIAKIYLNNKVEITREGAGSFTCARFVSEVLNYAGFNIQIGGVCDSVDGLQAKIKSNKAIAFANLQCGDIVIVKSPSTISPSGKHIGIFNANNKIIAEPGTTGPVAEQDITGANFIAAYRIGETAAVTAQSDEQLIKDAIMAVHEAGWAENLVEYLSSKQIIIDKNLAPGSPAAADAIYKQLKSKNLIDDFKSCVLRISPAPSAEGVLPAPSSCPFSSEGICSLLSANWEKPSAKAGDTVNMVITGNSCEEFSILIEVSKPGWFGTRNIVYSKKLTDRLVNKLEIPFSSAEKGDYKFAVKAYFGEVVSLANPNEQLDSNVLKLA